MKKNGFTLIELLAVIVILGVIMSLSVTLILKAQNNSKTALTNEQINSVKEAGKLLGVDLDDYYSDIYNCNSSSWISSYCSISDGMWTSVLLSLDDLISHDYFQDVDNHCSGSIKVTRVDSGYTVDLIDVTC